MGEVMTIQLAPQQLREALLVEQTVERAAKKLGISRRAFFDRMKKYPEITRGLRYRRIGVWEAS
jgi:transcriptional regulator of acetoin/glycerol metabolism